MNLEESKKLLRYLAGIDGRKVTNDATHAVHTLLKPFNYADVFDAVERVVERHPGDQWISLPKVRALLESARPTNRPTCEHGIPTGQCHDCEQGLPGRPGPPTHTQAQVIANLDLGEGRWVPQADPAEVYRLKVAARAAGVAYPGERTCLDGHDLATHRPVMGANGRMCGHPTHHPGVVPETEDVDW
jgi:hypothetical protein